MVTNDLVLTISSVITLHSSIEARNLEKQLRNPCCSSDVGPACSGVWIAITSFTYRGLSSPSALSHAAPGTALPCQAGEPDRGEDQQHWELDQLSPSLTPPPPTSPPHTASSQPASSPFRPLWLETRNISNISWSWDGCRPNLCISLHQFESRIQGNATDMTKYQTKVGALENVNIL